jgi:hypothetical protein
MSLHDGNWCCTAGDYNANNWTVEKGNLFGVDAYRVHPPKLKPTNGFGSMHCILFHLTERRDYDIFKV